MEGGRAGKPAQGLSLIEVLVVLVIMGVAWFAFVPQLSLLNQSEPQAQALDPINVLLDEARQKALAEGIPQEFRFAVGVATVIWMDRKAEWPATPSKGTLNDRPCPDGATIFRVYPSGFMDGVRLILEGGAVIKSGVTSCRFTMNAP